MIVQHKSAIISGNVVSVTLNNPVTAGNLIVVGATEVQNETTDLTGLISDGVNTYSLAVQRFRTVAGGNSIAAIFYAVAKSSVSLTVTFNDPNGSLDSLHVYEVSGGYSFVDATGFNDGSFTGGINSGAISTNGSTLAAAEFVLAVFQATSGGGGNLSFTGQPGNEGTEAVNLNSGAQAAFSEGFEVGATGVITASGTWSGGTGQNEFLGAVVATFSKTPTGPGPHGGLYHKPGSTLSHTELQIFLPDTLDSGHTCDGVVYSGTIVWWNGTDGAIQADSSQGDAAFPKLANQLGEYPSARVYISDCAFQPSQGARVRFLIDRDTAGDKLAIAVTSLS